MAASIEVKFYYTPDSRYSYFAATQIAALERQTGCTVTWRPLKPRALSGLRGANPFAGAPVSGQYERDYRRHDAACWAAYYNVPFREPDDPSGIPVISAVACAAAGRLERLVDYSQRMFRAIFVDGTPIDHEACVVLATELGLDRASFAEALNDPSVDADLDRSAAEAHRRGVFGVPTFFVGTRLFWGNDRLPLVRYFIEKERSRI